MSDYSDAPTLPLLMPDAGERDGVRWDGWRVVFPTDADYSDEHTAALHAHWVYGEPIRYVTEDDSAAEVARRAQGDRAYVYESRDGYHCAPSRTWKARGCDPSQPLKR